MTLESLAHLKERGLLGPAWLAREEQITKKWIASPTNQGWCWKIEGDSVTLFGALKCNRTAMGLMTLDNKLDMTNQLELAEDEINAALSEQAPVSEEMLG